MDLCSEVSGTEKTNSSFKTFTPSNLLSGDYEVSHKTLVCEIQKGETYHVSPSLRFLDSFSKRDTGNTFHHQSFDDGSWM